MGAQWQDKNGDGGEESEEEQQNIRTNLKTYHDLESFPCA